jgi:hypothetical protein
MPAQWIPDSPVVVFHTMNPLVGILSGGPLAGTP